MTEDALGAVLAEAQELGFLGPGPLARHVEHAHAMLGCLPAGKLRVVDLGSGGGLPGLVLAVRRFDLDIVLLDSQRRRCAFLRRAVMVLGLSERATVSEERAEVAARREELRGTIDAVVARSFGAPAVAAECAVGFLRIGGQLVVSEPPEPSNVLRWPPEGLGLFGFSPAVLHRLDGGSFVTMTKARQDERWPRRTGMPAKRPMWG